MHHSRAIILLFGVLLGAIASCKDSDLPPTTPGHCANEDGDQTCAELPEEAF